MKQSIRLGRIGGIPVGVHWSVGVIFALLTWELADGVFPNRYGGGSHPVYWVAAVVAATLFLLSLLLHEGSHAVVARRHQVGVRSITLWLFGGVAQLEGEALGPGADFSIAAAGPGTSIALSGVFAAVQVGMQHLGAAPLAVDVPRWLWEINLLLAGFNLIPAAPLDGGRILRAGLWRATHDRTRAAVMAARAGLGFGVVLVALGALEFLLGSPFGLWPAFLGWFLFSAARAEEAAAGLRGRTEGLRVGDVMVQPPPTFPSAMTVAELMTYWPWWHGGEAAALVGQTGWLDGVVIIGRATSLPVERRTTTRLGELAVPIKDVPVGRPDEPASALLNRIYAAGGAPAVVLDAANRLAGIVTLADIGHAAGAPRDHHSRV